jgi:hypothetical protein
VKKCSWFQLSETPKVKMATFLSKKIAWRDFTGKCHQISRILAGKRQKQTEHVDRVISLLISDQLMESGVRVGV